MLKLSIEICERSQPKARDSVKARPDADELLRLAILSLLRSPNNVNVISHHGSRGTGTSLDIINVVLAHTSYSSSTMRPVHNDRLFFDVTHHTYLPHPVHHLVLLHDNPIPNRPPPITDPHILNLNNHNPHILPSNKVLPPTVLLPSVPSLVARRGGRCEERLVGKGVVLEVLLAVETLLGGRGGQERRGAVDGGGDGGHGGGV